MHIIYLPASLATDSKHKKKFEAAEKELKLVEAQLGKVNGPCLWVIESLEALRKVLDLLDDTQAQTQEFLRDVVSVLIVAKASHAFCFNATRVFQSVVVAPPAQSLSLSDVLTVLKNPDAAHRVIACSTDEITRTVLLLRGDLTSVTIPFDSFVPDAQKAENNGSSERAPKLGKIRAAMLGKAIVLGKNAASVAELLATFDPNYEPESPSPGEMRELRLPSKKDKSGKKGKSAKKEKPTKKLKPLKKAKKTKKEKVLESDEAKPLKKEKGEKKAKATQKNKKLSKKNKPVSKRKTK